MKILVAEDNLFTGKMLRAILQNAGYTVLEARDDRQVWETLGRPDPPRLLVLAGGYPSLNGAELCARIRERDRGAAVPTYVILSASHLGTKRAGSPLPYGAHDCLATPFDPQELCLRAAIGCRMIKLQTALQESRRAAAPCSPPATLLPICSVCKKIRDNGKWLDVEDYMKTHCGVAFSHSLCPNCLETHYDKYNGES